MANDQDQLPPDEFARLMGAAFKTPDERTKGVRARILRSIQDVASQPPTEAAQPARNDRFVLREEIARGGMGIVYRALDTAIGRDVAIKVLRDDTSARPDLRARFVEEAQICGQLQHPCIVPVHEMGVFEDGRPYFTMKLIEGETLATHFAARNEGEADTEERGRMLAVFEKIAQTLAYAHSRGVIHRDLKPSNVMIGAFGEVQVMDWGLAKLRHRDDPSPPEPGASPSIETVRSADESSRSVAGMVMGTPAYMSPEQMRGCPDEVTEASDVFAFGAMLCELLTGDTPHALEAESGSSPAETDFAPTFERLESADADPTLIALAKDCLNPDPAARPSDAGRVANRLAAHRASTERRAQDAEVNAARAEQRAENARRLRRRTRVAALAIAVSALAIAATWIYLASDRQRRSSAANGALTDALASLDVRIDRARASDDEPTAWSAAEEAAERARALARSPVATAALVSRAKTAIATVEREANDARRRGEQRTRDQSFLRSFDEIRSPLSFDGRTRGPGELFDAYAAYGLDLRTAPADALARSIEASSVRAELIAGLMLFFGRTNDRPIRARIRAILDATDIGANWRTLLDQLDEKTASDSIELARDGLTVHQIDHVARRIVTRGGRTIAAYRQAIAFLQKCHFTAPQDFWNLTLTAFFLLRLEPPAFERAYTYAIAALAKRPERYEAWYLCAQALSGTDELARAEHAARMAIAREPKDVIESKLILATILMNTGRADEALTLVERARRPVGRNSAGFHRVDGLVQHARGDLEGAVTAFERAVERARATGMGADFRVLMEAHLAQALLNVGRIDDGVAMAETAIKTSPTNFFAQVQYAAGLLKAERFDEAAARLEALLERMPTNAVVAQNLGIVYTQLKRPRDALRLLSRSLELVERGGDASLSRRTSEGLLAATKRLVTRYRNRVAAMDALPAMRRGEVRPAAEDLRYAWDQFDDAEQYDALFEVAHHLALDDWGLLDRLFFLGRGAVAAFRASQGHGDAASLDSNARSVRLDWTIDRLHDTLDAIVDAVDDKAMTPTTALAGIRQLAGHADLGPLRAPDELPGTTKAQRDRIRAWWARVRKTVAGIRRR